MHPAFRKGLILCIATLVWFYAGIHFFDIQSPYVEWFNQQMPATKVKSGIWAALGGMLAVDAVWMVSYGLRQGRIR